MQMLSRMAVRQRWLFFFVRGDLARTVDTLLYPTQAVRCFDIPDENPNPTLFIGFPRGTKTSLNEAMLANIIIWVKKTYTFLYNVLPCTVCPRSLVRPYIFSRYF